MLVEDISDIENLLICPACKGKLTRDSDGALVCPASTCELGGQSFEEFQGKIALIDFDNSVVDCQSLRSRKGASVLGRERWRHLLGRIVDGKNRFAPHFARGIIAELSQTRERKPLILVVGGGGIGSGAEALYASPEVGIVSFDIYASPHVTFIADGHAIPLADSSVDGVWVQAVIEATVDPHEVVREMRRVLRPGGLLFANVAFMWPVCEQAYDFTRLSGSGLRWLFRDFEVISLGASSGPGTMVVLAIRYFAQSLLRSNKLGQIAALPFFWFRLFDRWCGTRRALDAAPALFFYGRLTESRLDLDGLVRFYEEQPALEKAARKFGS